MRRVGTRIFLTATVMAVVFGGVPGGRPALAQKSKDTGRGGVSCTYEKCMDNCIKASGKICTVYCEKTLKERRMSGVCK